MGQGAYFCGQGVAPFENSLAGALLIDNKSFIFGLIFLRDY